MTQIVYDGTFEGLLTGIYDIYSLKINTPNIVKDIHYTANIFDKKISVTTDKEKYTRVEKRIKELLGRRGLVSFWRAYLSEDPSIENTIYAILQKSIRHDNKNILSDFTNNDVVDLHKILKQIGREKHRMDAFVRFQQAEDGIYYATIEPDFNVLPLCISHFKNRFADQEWVIYDTKRNFGVYYDLNRTIPVELVTESNQLPMTSIPLSEKENQYQRLWKSYFKSTNIESRKNTKLHLRHVPKRYWKYLTEKQ